MSIIVETASVGGGPAMSENVPAGRLFAVVVDAHASIRFTVAQLALLTVKELALVIAFPD